MQAQAPALGNTIAADFALSDEKFAELKAKLTSSGARVMSHSDVESMIEVDGRELLRRLFQDHLSLRAAQERELGVEGPVVGSDGVVRTDLRDSHRALESVFGGVQVERVAHHTPGTVSLHPLDAALNLPADKYSFGVRRRCAVEAARGAFQEALQSIETTTGAHICKRQIEELVVRAATDFTAFYDTRAVLTRSAVKALGDLLVLTTYGKGIVMRHQSLRPATQRAASNASHKLKSRLCKGEKKNRKRRAQVAAVYTIARYRREPEDILRELDRREDRMPPGPRPRPEHKRVWASVTDDVEAVLRDAFDEAHRRDPQRTKTWVALSDGNEEQLHLLEQLAVEYEVRITIVLDLIHVIEYLWKAATVFHREGSPELEAWVTERVLGILRGKASDVAAGIRRSATKRGLRAAVRKPADKCADYLLKYSRYERYHEYLAAGLPIATGVIEGACRHLVKDRMDITGARWGLPRAEAVLKLRALRSSGDFEEYWRFHEREEQQRTHASLYANAWIPPMCQPPPPGRRRHLWLAP